MALVEGRAARVERRRCAKADSSSQESTSSTVLRSNEDVNEQEFGVWPQHQLSGSDSLLSCEEMVSDICCEVEVQCEGDSITTAIPAVVQGKAAKVNLKKVSIGCQTIFKSAFSYEKLKDNPESLHYYTGLETYDKFLLVLHSLGPAVEELNYRYNVVENVSVEDQFLMTLVKLRRAEPDLGLSMMFDVSKKTVQNIVVTWINFMYYEWSELNIWPSKDLVRYYMPNGFKKHYPSTRVILDGTEIPIAAPSIPLHQQAAFNTYKNRTTVKVMIGATPGGLISSVFPAYAGSTCWN